MARHPHAPKRPLKVKSSTATAPNDNHNPARKLASGSMINTALSASKKGSHTPSWRNHKRHASTRPSIAHARCTGTSKPASRP